ncbi:MAG: hypothetical protein IJZ84_06075 [Lachnospiraceae bacterium]|nr:hypothetical protein [Lachnospiraceae bacterium]
MKKGEKKWAMLPDLYMIMITTFDPFGEDSMVYTFENICREFPHIEYRDGLKFIYFNVIGKKCVARAKKELLTYLNHSKIESVTNEHVAHIHDYVTHVKQSAEVRERYMTIGEMMDRSKAEGEQDGRKKSLVELLQEILSDWGPIPEELQAQLENGDEETLKRWTKLAARAESIQEFLEQI